MKGQQSDGLSKGAFGPPFFVWGTGKTARWRISG
jgi:hypothetical protein